MRSPLSFSARKYLLEIWGETPDAISLDVFACIVDNILEAMSGGKDWYLDFEVYNYVLAHPDVLDIEEHDRERFDYLVDLVENE